MNAGAPQSWSAPISRGLRSRSASVGDARPHLGRRRGSTASRPSSSRGRSDRHPVEHDLVAPCHAGARDRAHDASGDGALRRCEPSAGSRGSSASGDRAAAPSRVPVSTRLSCTARASGGASRVTTTSTVPAVAGVPACATPRERADGGREQEDTTSQDEKASSAPRAPATACSSGFTFRKTRATVPSAAITTVERSTPMWVLPAKVFSTQNPYSSASRCSGSARSVNGRPYFCLNFACEASRVGADAEDDGAPLAERVPGVADPACLLRAPGRVVPGVEVEDDGPAAQFGEPDGLAGVALQLEVGSGLAFRDHGPQRTDRTWRRGRTARMPARADVAELVDAHGSGPCGGDPVEVQVLSSA